MFDDEEFDLIENCNEDDLYAFLGIGKNATQNEITQAYRRLSKVFHPDKHIDEQDKKRAQRIFNRVKRAHEVLSDEHSRAVYDCVGMKGLEMEGWAVVKRTKTADEIREEYERIVNEKKKKRFEQRTNQKGIVSVGANLSDFFDDEEIDGFPSIEVTQMMMSQSIDAPLTDRDTLTISGTMSVSNGTGNGTVGTALRHVISAKTWTEVEFVVGQGPILAFKGFRNLTNRCFVNGQLMFHVTSVGVRPGIQAVVMRQLDHHLMGYLTWKAGMNSSMNTMIVWDQIKHNLSAAIQFGIQNSFVSLSYTHKLSENQTKLKISVKGGTFGVLFDFGCETQLTQYSHVGATMSIGVPQGVTLKLRFMRASQHFVFPLFLCGEIEPKAVFYGTITPILTFYCVKNLFINRWAEIASEKQKQKAKQENETKLKERMNEAKTMISLMNEAYNRIINREKQNQGLIITKAIYADEEYDFESEFNEANNCFDVTIPLQCLVDESSTLTLSNSSKSQIPGFYDVNFGHNKKLWIQYEFRQKLHQVIIDDLESIKLPQQSHLIE